MPTPSELLHKNRTWAERTRGENPGLLERLATGQAPEHLWIGCVDSRVPPTHILDSKPGDLLVHRNVANVVAHTDLSLLSVLQFGVEVLKVRHILLCGHDGCGGVETALKDRKLGLIDNWLRPVQAVMRKHKDLLSDLGDESERFRRLCALNALEQAIHLCQTTVVQTAWERGQPLTVHTWIYDVQDGRIHDLGLAVSGNAELSGAYQAALERLSER